ncbi:MAG: hypothetical protein WD075_07420 [Rhodospirillales bacterium]
MAIFRAKTSRILAFATALVCLLSACQTTAVYTNESLKRSEDRVRLLVMPMDVELSEVSFGGVPSIRADWTEAASGHLRESLAEFLASRKVEIIAYTPPDEDPIITSHDQQLVKLFSVVGNSISVHQYIPAFALPSKKEQFDWSLGNELTVLAKRYNADYALFLTVKDSYATAERAAAIAVAAILFGVSLQGGVQQGASALVDLKTGEFAWFNQLARGTGDVRTAKPAKETITFLMQEFPK